jgi:hypothetical protein
MYPRVGIAVAICFCLPVIACGGGAGSNSTTQSPSPSNTNPSAPPTSSSQPPAGPGGGSSGSGSAAGSTPQSGFVEKKFSLPSSGGLLAADFNRDGHTDLLVYGASLQVLLNNGSGEFATPIVISLPSPYTAARQVELADFNSDGYIDAVACVVSPSMAGAAVIFLNDHSGKLVAGQAIASPSACEGLAAGDANHDGKPDVVITYFTGSISAPSNAITTWFNDGSAHFANPVTQNVSLTATQDTTRNPCWMKGATGADFDGDGTLDLMLFGACQSDVITPGDIFVARGTGAGQYVVMKIDESNSTLSGTPIIKDINGDGKPDVICVQALDGPHGSSGTDLKFAINNGAGAFSLITAASESAYAGDGGYVRGGSSFTSASSAAEGFANSTCCSQPASYGVKLFTQLGSAAAQTWTYGQATDGTAPGTVTGLVTADFDGNGARDLAAVEEDLNHNSTLHVHLNFNK